MDVIRFTFHGIGMEDRTIEVPIPKDGIVQAGVDAPAGYSSVSVAGPDVPPDAGLFYID